MHAAPPSRRHQLARHLYYSLLTHLTRAGITITHEHTSDEVDATWTARTATLTLRADADLEDHIAVLSDLSRMVSIGEPSWRGVYRTRARHLSAVPTSA